MTPPPESIFLQYKANVPVADIAKHHNIDEKAVRNRVAAHPRFIHLSRARRKAKIRANRKTCKHCGERFTSPDKKAQYCGLPCFHDSYRINRDAFSARLDEGATPVELATEFNRSKTTIWRWTQALKQGSKQ